MRVIVHKIRLKPNVDPERFESWVRDHDYATCPRLPSLLGFRVHAVSRDPRAAFHYFEIIEVDSLEAFEADMQTDAFRALVAAFEPMADVVEELSGAAIPPGYRR